jgi:hypothetical protein
MLNAGSPIHDGSFAALKALGADYVRYVPWLPYPKIAVAELEPPTKDQTSWDFTDIDPVTKDFLAATEGYSTIVNFNTIPAWMFKTDKPVKYPEDTNQVFWDYTQGTELHDIQVRSQATTSTASLAGIQLADSPTKMGRGMSPATNTNFLTGRFLTKSTLSTRQP